MGLLDALHVGRSGLAAASAGIDVTSQNVTNASTEGYSRRSLQQVTSDPVFRDGLWLGTGTDLSAVLRSSDRLLGVRLVAGAGENAYATSLESAMKVTEAWFDESQQTGLVEAYDSFFDALSATTSDPSDASLRLGAIDAARTLASVVSRTATGLEATLDGFDEEAVSSLEGVNEKLAEVAALNAQIGKSGATTGPADLLDRRDQLIRELGEAVGATVELKADGQATVYIGGHAVVSGTSARTLSIAEDADGVPQVYVSADGGKLGVTDQIGGSLGGLLEARAQTQGYLDQLDAFAYTFANAANAQHAAGYDQDGAAGGDLFSVSATEDGAAASLGIDASLEADPTLLALAGDATAYAGDDGNLQALLAMEDDTSIFSGSTGRTFLSSLVTTVGTDTAAATASVEAAGAILSDLESLRESVSGVDTDEEAIRLVEYQAAYRAAARVISVTDELLTELIAIGR